MKKTILISLIYLSSLALLISCSDKRFSQASGEGKKNLELENITPRCTERLIQDLGYTPGKYTQLVMGCNILNIKRLNREIKAKDRIVVAYLETKCGEISRMLSQYNAECKKTILIGVAN